jgi:hypothetical protein
MLTGLRQKRFWLVVLVFSILLVMAVVAIWPVRQGLLRTYSNYVLTNTERYLPCEELPLVAKAEAVFKQQEGLRQKVLAVSSDTWIGLERNEATRIGGDVWHCPGRADVLITVNGEAERRRIVLLLGNDFAGIPYRVINV